MTDPIEILRAATHVVVQDYPRVEIPEALTRAGLTVTIYGGPNEADVVASELVDGKVVTRPVGRWPGWADVLSVYRPLDEIDEILADAQRMGVRTVWRQPDANATRDDSDAESATWRERVEAAGLTYLDSPNIDVVARQLEGEPPRN